VRHGAAGGRRRRRGRREGAFRGHDGDVLDRDDASNSRVSVNFSRIMEEPSNLAGDVRE
jgi:hypothetical protein